MAGMVLHSVFFSLFSILTLVFIVLFFDEDDPYDKLLLFFAFLAASLFVVCAAKNLLEALAQ